MGEPTTTKTIWREMMAKKTEGQIVELAGQIDTRLDAPQAEPRYLESRCAKCGAIPIVTQGAQTHTVIACGQCGLIMERAA